MLEVPKCKSLEEVRLNIDKIDSRIVELIVQRGVFVRQAAKFKKSVDEVKAPKREEEIISKVRELAEKCGGNPIIVENVYRAMIAAFINEELSEHTSLNAAKTAP